jgi:iron complex outermembrane receptor protein
MRHGLLTVGLLAGAGTALAAEKPIEEVVVRGTVFGSEMAMELAQYGNDVQIITDEAITRGGYTNIAQAFQQEVRGGFVRYSPDEGEFVLRLDGGLDNDTLVLQDGLPLLDRGPALETIWGATVVDPHLVEQIEVFRGGQSLYFGSNSGVGVVNIVTKKPDGTAGGEFGARYGAWNTRELWGNVKGVLDGDGNHSFMFYGGYMNTEAPTLFSDEAYVDTMIAAGANDFPFRVNRNNLGAKYYWNIDETLDFRAHAQYSQIDFQDTFPSNTAYAPNYSKHWVVDFDLVKEWNRNVVSDAMVWWRRSALTNVELRPGLQQNEDGTQTFDGTLVPFADRGLGDVEGAFQEFGIQGKTNFYLEQGTQVVVGFQNINYGDDSDEEIAIEDDVFSNVGVYVDLRPRLPFSPSTNLSIAGRVDSSSSFDAHYTWKAGLRQPLGDRLSIRANGGTSFALPLANELYFDDEFRLGNPDLEMEETFHWSVGLDANTYLGQGEIEGSIGYFQTSIDNRIRVAPDLTPDGRDTWINQDEEQEITGGSVRLAYRPTATVSVDFSATFIESEDPAVGQQIDAIPEWYAVGSMNWDPTDRIQVSLLPRVNGPTYTNDTVNDVRYNYGDFFTVDATINYLAGIDREHRFQLRIVNLDDEEYFTRGGIADNRFASDRNIAGLERYFYGWNARGRSAFVTYQYELGR